MVAIIGSNPARAGHDRAMIIDFHTHVFPPRVRDNRERYLHSDRCFAELYSSPKAAIATAEELLDVMDRDGVDVSVVLNGGWESRDLCVETNDYILESVARHPGRLVGFCTVPLDLPEAPAEIERCVRGGARGVGEIRPSLPLTASALERMDLIIEVIRQHRLILLTHASEPVGHRYQGKGNITPGLLYPLITRYPDVTLVCAHWGGGLPFYALMPEVKEALGNALFDTAASPFLYRPEVYAEVVNLVGADRVLFGSDYPLLRTERLLKEIGSSDLSAEARRQILSGNARRLLGIADPERDETTEGKAVS